MVPNIKFIIFGTELISGIPSVEHESNKCQIKTGSPPVLIFSQIQFLFYVLVEKLRQVPKFEKAWFSVHIAIREIYRKE